MNKLKTKTIKPQHRKVNHRRIAAKVNKQVDSMAIHTMHIKPIVDRAKGFVCSDLRVER